MLIFAAVLILVLWFCQIVYLEKIYKFIKEREVENTLSHISDIFEKSDDNIMEGLEKIASDAEICIRVVDEDGKTLYSVENSFGCTIHSLTTQDMQLYYNRTADNGGKLVFTSDEETKKRKNNDNMDRIPPPQDKVSKEAADVSEAADGEMTTIMPAPDNNKRPIEDNLIKDMQGGRESMVCASIMQINDTLCLVLVDARLTPVDATVNTLRIELSLISVIMVLLALILAYLVSRAIASPIIKVNDAAKQLAKGNYDVVFDGRDYTEINELSDTLNYTSKELAKTEKYQQELIANVSHDLRTPLTMITAYSEVMRDLPGENTPENVQVIIEESERLTNLVNDLLDISKLQNGTLEKEAKVYDLTESIERVMERYGKLKTQEGYDIRFVYNTHVLVEADEYKIFQVLYNLINNAINYTGEDKKVIVRQIVTKNKVRIEVEDTGMGIAKEELNNVWERYYKASSSHKRAVKGTGLGLSIVRNILKLHDASYGVISEEGKGSTFWFELDRYLEENND